MKAEIRASMWDLTFPMRHLYSPGTVQGVGVKVRKARRQNSPRLTINIASTKSCRKKVTDKEEWKGGRRINLFFTADILTCHSRKGPGVPDNITAGSVLFTR